MTLVVQTLVGIVIAGAFCLLVIAAIQMLVEDVSRGRRDAARAERLRHAAGFYDQDGRL